MKTFAGCFAAACLWLGSSISHAENLEALQSALDEGNLEPVQAWADGLGQTALGPDQLYVRGQLLLRSGQAQQALNDLEAAARERPDSQVIWLALAEAAGEVAADASMIKARGLAKKARLALERVVEINPANLDARVGLIQFHLQAPWIAGGRSKEAYRQASAIGELDPALGARWKARIDLVQGKVDSAETLYRTLLTENPKEPQAAVGLALLLQQQERWAEAVATLEPFASGETPDLMALYQLGRTGALSGQHLAQSETALRRYLELADRAAEPPIPPSPAWWRLGMVLAHDGRTVDARAAFQRALELDPENGQAADALKRLPAD